MLSLEMAFFLFYRQKVSPDLLALCARLTEVCRSKKVDKITLVATLKWREIPSGFFKKL